MSNICHNCKHHEICSIYRYNNIRMEYMIKANIKENKDGNMIIFVDNCSKFLSRKFKYPLKILDK